MGAGRWGTAQWTEEGYRPHTRDLKGKALLLLDRARGYLNNDCTTSLPKAAVAGSNGLGEDCGAGDVGVRWPFRPEGTEDFRGKESKVNGSGEELAALSLLRARVARIQTKKTNK